MLSITKTVRDEVLCNSARDQYQRYFLLGVYQHPRLSEGKKYPTQATLYSLITLSPSHPITYGSRWASQGTTTS